MKTLRKLIEEHKAEKVLPQALDLIELCEGAMLNVYEGTPDEAVGRYREALAAIEAFRKEWG